MNTLVADSIQRLLQKTFNIKGKFSIDQHDCVSVQGDVALKKRIEVFPINFGKVSGNFYASDNSLRSLQGSPRYVGKGFFCNNNSLISLQDAPRHVGGSFVCSDNQLQTLQDSPAHVGGNFDCSNNNLTNLKGVTEKINGFFNCMGNHLQSLWSLPKEIKGNIYITAYSDTPLLRLLLINGIVEFDIRNSNAEYIPALNSLFQTFYGSGRQGIMECGLEMIKLDEGRWANNARLGT